MNALNQAMGGLRIERQTDAVGVVQLAPLRDHRLSVHAGPPARLSCTSTHRYTRGDLTLLPAGFSGTWVEEEPATSIVVQLPPALLRRAAEDLGRDPDRTGLEPRHQFRDARIEHVAWALDAERRAGHPNGRLYTDSLGLALAVHLLGHYAVPGELRSGLSSQQLRRLTDYIEEHLDQNLTLPRLARVVEVSASHLKTQFRRSMGVPVHQYVIQRRVERARALLLKRQLAPSQVALEAGFSHQSHMARWMKRVLGVTPTSLVRGAPSRRGLSSRPA
ncbi:helix-turn-helix transcriptional regulator [Pyxidicoccus parkwayensis]|uniref:Helix-turn-helix transcriptional regulator n=1 Tax=Pyxidicoccus parkwayensis TaxID=2813578 RepID=A0ABX7NKK0_9BACT|nr:AraC family transcriptional regulator [Pyxidicoccus parkwaysis]QSQ18966.1 helix-turn-helix transcriptional regulator [Pyxidicoccus parkwaysis]